MTSIAHASASIQTSSHASLSPPSWLGEVALLIVAYSVGGWGKRLPVIKLLSAHSA